MPNPIICGPMVRKVTEGSVSVFLALNELRRVGLRLYSDPQGANLIAQTENDPRRIGKKLWVLVITLSDLQLQPAQNYHYNISLFNGLDGTTEDLADLGFLSPDNPIIGFPLGYEAGRLPGFALPPGLEYLNIIHGSCRKAHGNGPDQLARLDELIEAGYDDPLKRPHQLFLTGDQIYADDVAMAPAEMLSLRGIELLGFREHITGSIMQGHVETSTPFRKDFIKTKTKLTSTESEHHLVYLSEFYGMYLFAWSGYPLERTQLLQTPVFTPPTGMDAEDAAELAGQVDRYCSTLHKVRRALANIPSYMMFDDHEVTDDWFMYGSWKTDSLHDETTRRIIRNGLTAYAIFQDWGNQPEQYETANAFWDAVEYSDNGATGRIRAFENGPEAQALYSFLGLDPANAAHLHNWYYRLSFPEHNVYAIDTRTRRYYIGNYTMLIAIAKYQEQLPVPDDTDKVTIVLSPAPIIGMPLIEELQRFAVKQLTHKLATTLDDEAWAGDPIAFNLLLEHLAKFKRVIVLSGDVHYGYTNNCSFFPGTESGTQAARIVQLCSSSLKNGGGFAEVPAVIDFGLHEESFAYYDQAVAHDITIREAIKKENHRRVQNMENKITIKSYEKLNPPARPGSIRIFSCRDLLEYKDLLGPVINLQQTQGRYSIQYLNHDIATHYDAAAYSPDWLKKILSATNIGQLTFEKQGAELDLIHRLHFQKGTANQTFSRRSPLTIPPLTEKPTL